MSVSRDDFSIAFRSALLQRGGAQKFSVLSLIFLALIIFFLDVYGAKFTKPVRGFLNDVVYRITFLASTPTRFFPQASKDLSKYFNVKAENERLKAEIEKYKSLELNVEFLTDENKNLQKILETEYFNKNLSNVVLAKVLVDKNSPFLKSIIINKGTRTGIMKGMPVTHNNYLVGRVVETNYLSSRVLLLNDLPLRDLYPLILIWFHIQLFLLLVHIVMTWCISCFNCGVFFVIHFLIKPHNYLHLLSLMQRVRLMFLYR